LDAAKFGLIKSASGDNQALSYKILLVICHLTIVEKTEQIEDKNEIKFLFLVCDLLSTTTACFNDGSDRQRNIQCRGQSKLQSLLFLAIKTKSFK